MMPAKYNQFVSDLIAAAASQHHHRLPNVRPPVHLRLTCPIVFTREKYVGALSQPEVSGEMNGTTDVTKKVTTEMRTHFQVIQHPYFHPRAKFALVNP